MAGSDEHKFLGTHRCPSKLQINQYPVSQFKYCSSVIQCRIDGRVLCDSQCVSHVCSQQLCRVILHCLWFSKILSVIVCFPLFGAACTDVVRLMKALA